MTGTPARQRWLPRSLALAALAKAAALAERPCDAWQAWAQTWLRAPWRRPRPCLPEAAPRFAALWPPARPSVESGATDAVASILSQACQATTCQAKHTWPAR